MQTFLKSVKTTEEAQKLTLQIDNLLESLFYEGKEEFEKAVSAIRYDVSEIIKEEFLRDEKYNGKETIKDFLTKLKEKIQTLKILELNIAFDPSDKTIETIHDWVLNNIGEDYVLSVTVDKRLIGGAIVIYDGKYKDFSLKKKLDEVFAAKREEIAEIFL